MRIGALLLAGMVMASGVRPVGFAPAQASPAAAQAPPTVLPVYGYAIVNTYPHDRNAFTQGLQYVDGALYEGTGLHGESSIRKVKLETGEVMQRQPLSPAHFGEGITVRGGELVQLTWKSGLAFVYDAGTFQPKRTFTYAGEGWGLTQDKAGFIMSDGTDALRFLDPRSFKETRRLRVTANGAPLKDLTELEYVKGEIFANVWMTDRIARIDPSTGRVTGWIDLAGLLPVRDRWHPDQVLNGIAHDEKGDRLFVTGKLWPKLFEIRLVRK